MSSDWDWPGSRWWRVDLHTHSPASHDFGAPADRQHPDASRWIEAAKQAGLEAVAVTDHNTAAGMAAIQSAAEAAGHAPTVFPGVELTASCGTHVLVILDPAAGFRHVEELLTEVKVPVDHRGDKDARSTLSVEDIFTAASNGRRIVIAAHVNGPAGLLEHDGQQRCNELRHPGLAGAEVDPDRDLDGTWLDGSRPAIGRRVPRVWSSDAHQFRDLGRRFTWIKMTRPNLEGLRLALLDGDDSSLRPATREDPGDPNRHADLAIESVTVHAAKHMGRDAPLEFRFNPWLNAIIGGRGTGKSTLIDFCRKTLRRDDELDGTPLRDDFDRRLSVYAKRGDEGLVTDETRLEILYRKDGARFLISWDARGGVPAIQRIDGEKLHQEEGEVRERFPVRIYSQKQLFELARDPNALLRVIDDSPDVRGSEWKRQIDEAAEHYLSLRASERASRTKAAELGSRRAALADAKRKLEMLQQGGRAKILAGYRRTRQQNDTWLRIVEDARQRIDSVARAADDLAVSDLDFSAADEGDPGVRALHRLHGRLRAAMAHLQSALAAEIAGVRSSLDALTSNADDDSKAWTAAVSASQVAYEEASARLAESGVSSPDAYRTLLAQVSTLERDVQALEDGSGRADALAREATTALARHRNLFDDWSRARIEFARTVSGERLHVEVRARSTSEDRESTIRALRVLLGVDRFESAFEKLAGRITPAGQPWSWDRLDAIVGDLRDVAAGRVPDGTLGDRRFETAVSKLTPERLDRLALFAPDDAVDVSFRNDPKERWTPLSHGSPGQQSASLLAFVLGYGNEPIILDQPEDDLDNTLIYRVLVQRLRETKTTRQVIVVTHNPNIVVHGDAELVLSLDARGSQTRITRQDGLQTALVRDEVCRVMEGGKKAFEDRYRRMMPVREDPA